MLQRAANDAYSWWWASHIRTKQSKWLEQSLQDQEEKTQYVLGLIQEEGDSFAKRAEMYYKRRPELINYVEESYRAFRALAERYDHISTELQNANNTLATCFPEQFQMPMDDDDFDSPRAPRFPMQVPPSDPSNVPKVPTEPLKNLKGIITTASKQSKIQKFLKASGSDNSASKSGLSKSEALDEIDKLQKDILALQTVKEFVKSSYQSGLEKFYDIENTIMEKQQRVSQLQHEFGVRKVIEDDEARKLMAEAAIKSCQETLSKLQETQQKSAREAKEEGNKIEDARERIKSIRHRFLPEKTDAEENPSEKDKSIKKDEKQQAKEESIGTGDMTPSSREDLPEIAQVNIQFDASSMSSITVSELAEKIDELVSKVISLEDAVSSQTALIERLRSEARELHANIQTLEDDKSDLKEGTQGLSNKVKELEHKLSGLQDLNQNVESQNSNIETHFVDAQCSLNNLSEKLSSVKPDEEPESVTPSQDQKLVQNINTLLEDKEKQKDQTSIDSKGIDNPSEKGDANAQENTNEKGVAKSPIDGKGIVDPSETGDVNVQEHTNEKGVAKSPSDGKGFVDPSETGDVNVQEHTNEKGVTKSPIDGKGVVDPSEIGVANVQEHTTGKEGVDKSPIESKEIANPSETGDGNAEEHTNGKEVAKSPTSKTVMCDDTKIENMEQQTTTVSEESREIEDSKDRKEKDELSWQMMLLSGDEDREKILVKEYTTILRNYKEVKKKLDDMEKKNSYGQPDDSIQIKELKYAIGKRDEEIQKLRRKLNENNDSPSDNQKMEEAHTEGDDDFSFILSNPVPFSQVEENLRTDIDSILDENLGFWLRFSSAFHQIQKFKTTVDDLQGEINQIREKQQQEDNATTDVKSEVRPLYKHLKEIQAELEMWLEKCASLKEESERRFSSLCGIQEKISVALKESVEEDNIIFSSHQAAKFQGEVLNMKQENNKVKEELQAGFEHITTLKGEVDSTLTKLNDEFELSGNRSSSPLGHLPSRSRIPLQLFIFGSKSKQQKKPSLFSRMHQHRKYQALRAGLPP